MMETRQIVDWLLDKAVRAHDVSWLRMMTLAADRLQILSTRQKWTPVTEGMPKERQSIVPGLGTVSKPVLVTWMDPTSDKPYPDNCFVREGITRNGEFTLHHINGDLLPVAWMYLPEPYEQMEERP